MRTRMIPALPLRTARSRRHAALLTAVAVSLAPLLGCQPKEKPYGIETRLRVPAEAEQVWAVAPAINLSGQRGVDPLLQADLLFKELQTVRGIRAVPVNRVAEVFASMRIDRIDSPEQAQLACELLGADAIVVPAVTFYDPYDPPKLGAAVSLFARDGSILAPRGALDMDGVRDLARAAREQRPVAMEQVAGAFVQEAGMYDAAHGSVRAALQAYAQGRNDPQGPAAGVRAYLLSMDRYAGFVYHDLLFAMMRSLAVRSGVAAAG